MSANYCVDCASPIPAGQRTCSMCYGDIDHGRDGYYRQWAEEMMREDNDREMRGQEAMREEMERQQ